jgi:hypothetical protein
MRVDTKSPGGAWMMRKQTMEISQMVSSDHPSR